MSKRILNPRPCPFCGSHHLKLDGCLSTVGWQWTAYRVVCVSCAAVGPERKTQKDAVSAWNGKVKKP